MRNVLEEVEKIKTHVVLSITFLSRALYKVMRKNAMHKYNMARAFYVLDN
jgi:hypothetical protein